jgi:hypothetical protein
MMENAKIVREILTLTMVVVGAVARAIMAKEVVEEVNEVAAEEAITIVIIWNAKIVSKKVTIQLTGPRPRRITTLL